MATAYDQWKTSAPEPAEIDSAAYSALKAHPVMVEEAMTNQDGAFWAMISCRLYGKGLSEDFIPHEIRDAVEEYVKEKVEDYAEYNEVSVNEAIHCLLNECNK